MATESAEEVRCRRLGIFRPSGRFVLPLDDFGGIRGLPSAERRGVGVGLDVAPREVAGRRREVRVEDIDVGNHFGPDHFYPKKGGKFSANEWRMVVLVERMMAVVGGVGLRGGSGVCLQIGAGGEGQSMVDFAPFNLGGGVLSVDGVVDAVRYQLSVMVRCAGETTMLSYGYPMKKLLAVAEAVVEGATDDDGGLRVRVCRREAAAKGVVERELLVRGFRWPEVEAVALGQDRRRTDGGRTRE